MSNPIEQVDRELIRTWGLPDPGDSKKSRGEVVVVGGSRRSPGAVLLAGEATLRVGAGRLGLAVPGSVEAILGVALPEAAVFTLPARATDPLPDRLLEQVEAADAVLVGPGFDHPEETRGTILAVASTGPRVLVLDAYAIGVLPGIERDRLPKALVLNVNTDEASILLGRAVQTVDVEGVREIARRYQAVVNCYGTVATEDGECWRVMAGGPGLGTSGSGDVLAGAITGFAARGVQPSRAAVWGSWVHARAGDRLSERVGLGFLARDLAPELTLALAEVA